MARLDIEVAGNNSGFKSTVKDTMSALEDLKKFGEGLKIDMFGNATASELKTLEKSLTSVSKVLKTFTTDANAGTRAINSGLKTAITELKVSEQGLKNEYQKSRAELAKYALEQRKLADAQKAEAATARASEMAQKNLLAERRRGEMEARKLAAIIEKNRKQVERESSEYYKLSTTLGKLRKEAKDVLAEMFRLEAQGKKGSVAYQQLADKARVLTAQTNHLDTGLKKIDSSLGLHQRNVGNYSGALSALSPQFSRLSSQLQMMGVDIEALGTGGAGAFAGLGTSLATVGRNVLAFLVSPVGLAIVALGSLFAIFKSGAPIVKEFNSGLLNVSKTTGISGAELERLSDSIIGLSRSLQTVSTDKLLEYATVAGQLGVKGTKNILAFSEALAKLETASDISGEQGASEIARLLTLTDGGVQNIAAFGDEIVNLGNNFAATEKEILGNAERIAQNTGLYKVGRQDVLAYATATKAVGLEAEIVGSSLFRTLAMIEKYSNGAKGSEKITNLLGISQAELNKQFKESSSTVLMNLIGALNKVDQAGGSVTGTLNTLGMNNVRDIAVLGTLASKGYGQLEAAMLSVRDASGALEQEFRTKAGSLANQTERIGIAWNNLVLDIENGSGIIGRSVVYISGVFADFLDRLSKFSTPTGWNEFVASLTSFKAADVVRDVNKAVSESRKALEGAGKINFATGSAKQIEESVASLSSAYESATKSLELYKKSVEAGLVSNKGKTNIKQLEDIVKSLDQRLGEAQFFAPKVVVPKKTVVSTVIDEEAAARAAAAARKIEDIIRDSNARIALSGTENREKELAQIDNYYKERMRQVGTNNKALAILTENRRIEESAINLKWNEKEKEARQKTEDEITSILTEAGISRVNSRQQELDKNNAKYDAYLNKYRGNADAMLKIDEARAAEAANINQKWNAKEGEIALETVRRLNENRSQTLLRQLEKERDLKVQAANGDKERLLQIQKEYLSEVDKLRVKDQETQIELAFDGSSITTELAAVSAEIEQIKRDFDASTDSVEAFREKITSLEIAREQLNIMKQGVDGVAEAFGSLSTDILFNTEMAFENLGKSFANVAKSMIGALAKIGAQYLINQVIGTTSMATTTAASGAAAAATASAWSTAAALVAAATFGASAVAGGTAIAALVASTKALSLTGFSTGGYTGNVATNQIAGVVHGKEYVINAAATARHKGLLESINNGTFTGSDKSKVSGNKLVSQTSEASQVFISNTRIEGPDLVIAYERASKDLGRYSG